MPDNKNHDASLVQDSMILTAQSFQRVVKELEQNRPEPTRSEALLFEGTAVAVPVLLSLATEIALKAWLRRERKRKPARKRKPRNRHGLLELFDELEPGTQEMLGARMDPLRKVLCFHREAFGHWRYLYEDPRGVFQTSELDRALTVIIDAYNNMPDEWA